MRQNPTQFFGVDTRSVIVQNIAKEAVDNRTIFGLDKPWFKRMAMVMSYPAIETDMFNEDGTDEFHSKSMFLVSIPSAVLLLMLVYILLYPLFLSTELTTKIISENPYSGIFMFNNLTNMNEKPISKNYAKLNKVLGHDAVGRETLFVKEFFDSIRITL